MRYATALIVLISTILVALSVEEEAKLKFGRVYDLWLSGEYERASEEIEEILYKPIDVNDITKFWYLRARIYMDLGRVNEALKSLKNVLVINPTGLEVLSLIKELEFLLGKREYRKNYRLKELGRIKGFKDGVEYFYTLDDLKVWGDEIFAVDRVNSRLLEYRDFTLQKTVDLPFEPFNVEVSPKGKMFVSGTDGGIYKIEAGRATKLATATGAPILAGFDRSGSLWGISGMSVFRLRGGRFEERRIPWGRPVITDAEITREGLWALDVLHKRLILMDLENLKIVKDIPLPGDMRSFEVTPRGDFILLTEDGKMVLMDEKQNIEELEVEAENVVPMEYDYPILSVADWKKHEIEIFSLAGDEPILVKIDSFSVNENTGEVNLFVRFEDLYGDPLNMAKMFTFVSVDEGRVGYEIEHSVKEVERYTSDVDFLSEKLPSLKRGIGYDVVIPGDSFVRREDVVVLRDKSVRVFTKTPPEDPTLKWVVSMSGGGWSEEVVESVRSIWKIRTSYTPSISIKIIPISVGINLGSEMFMDTIYVVERGVINEGG